MASWILLILMILNHINIPLFSFEVRLCWTFFPSELPLPPCNSGHSYNRALIRILNVGARKKSLTYEKFWNLTNQKFLPYSPQNVGARLHPCKEGLALSLNHAIPFWTSICWKSIPHVGIFTRAPQFFWSGSLKHIINSVPWFLEV